MENKEIIQIFSETADLMEIAGQDAFRIRSYRNAIQAIENLTERLEDILSDAERKLTDIPSIGKGMAAHIGEICQSGQLSVHQELRSRYPPVALKLLQIQGLGPKGTALLFQHFRVQSLEDVEQLARKGKLRDLPRMGEKLEQKILKSIEAYKRSAGRYLIDVADGLAAELREYLAQSRGVKKVTSAGSLRRGCESIGDLDLLVTGGSRKQTADHLLKFPKVAEVIASGENKVSVKLKEGIQVDVRMLAPESYGAAMQYFTGSKAHNVALRDRAKRMGYKLSEYGLFRISDDRKVAGRTEEEVYQALDLSYIEPELRENTGEIDAAAAGKLPRLLRQEDIRGDLHMHTTATDGRCSILEMAQAAQQRNLEYIAITDHSQALAMANGMNEKRVLAQIKEIRKAESRLEGFRIFAGTEVDIHREGRLDLDDEVLAQLDVVVASVHSLMNLPAEQMTDRLLAAFENPYLNILAHPTGRLVLRREAFGFDLEKIVAEARRRNIAMEVNSFPDRLDLRENHIRLCKQRGVKLVISTDSHHTKHLSHLKYGVLMARRGWLEKRDVLNTLPAAKFQQAIKRRC
ncbi:MAG: DNA polymerase/3'-5' exonuclease PolX [Acidobacteria bacterium]|nr:DNA polymerase/3'-5' exonuclease PolX [Acidobacteriota bacterium]MCZ6750423.1 DNA polymerase/3'-5' exonuclease PolX [Acidobacteriota bacterium]